jgi:EAL domain-containing protein (putative c-di-GMP-specific phosphodiesterase class I)
MAELGNTITELARHPFRLPRETLNLSATIGAAVSEPGQTDAGALLRDGQTALFQAKSSTRSSKKVIVFERSMRAEIIGAHRLMNDLPQAIERDELYLQYQPIIDIRSRQVAGLEALVRWNHPELGSISPSQFIPVAEETGLVLPLGRWVIQHCCNQVRSWLRKDAIPHELTVNINVATHQLVDAELLPLIASELDTEPLTRRHINLELTESALMENPEASLRVFEQLHEMGIKLYVDDFGTGYSSFSYLTQLPISALKIDRSFVTRMKASTKECEVVRSIVQLAKNLQLSSVAEGVECEEDLNPLVEMGCDRAQGYLFSRPVGGDDTPGVIAKLNEAAP